jgi:iron-sulfur cluster repair protein YtfE (RIC family)
MSFQQIVEEIMATHHSLLKRELPKISQQLEKLSAEYADNETIAEAKQIFAKVRNKVETHLKDEETALFPDGIALERGGISVSDYKYVLERLDEMEKEHDGCGKTLTMIQTMLASALPQSTERDDIILNIQLIQDDFVAHVEKENHKVHPMLREMIASSSPAKNPTIFS